ncbi:hypothetical protein [Paenibacillus thermotolerans]|uniref:hypothetical protein n=1 Tax=Paenibacillus thermotolerans TaxID=3027807 RepID=UPI0023677079|nr:MULTISPECIES: hypothetical protein [unclassified Paenibacillus]
MTVHIYIVGNLKDDVELYIKKYEEFTWIDQFMSNSSKPWFYEYTIQGFIYYNLVRQFDYAARGQRQLFFLEEPYSKTSNDNRADIMFVEFDGSGKLTAKNAIEIKTDFQLESIYMDLLVLASHIEAKNIAKGYGIFFATSQDQIDEAVKELKSDIKLKKYFTNHTLYAVGMIGNPE